MFKTKSKKNQAKRTVLVMLALALVAVIGIGSGLAYLSDFDAQTNKFTLGDTNVDIEEPNWKNPEKSVTAINGDNKGMQNLSGEKVVEGDVLTYAVTATNGDIAEHDIVITDTVEAGLTVNVDSISNGGVYDAATRTITWTLPNVLRLSDVTVYFSAAVNGDAVTSVDNDAWAKVGDEKAKQTNTVTNPLTEEPQQPVKRVNESSESGKGGSNVTVGDLITYDIIAYNNADTVGTVTVVDTLDSQVSFFDATGGGIHSNGTVTWTFNDMAAHSSKIVTLTVKVETVEVDGKLDPITNKVTTTDPTNTYESNTVTNPTNTPDSPKKPVKTYAEDTAAGIGGAKVNVGDAISYKIQYYNHEDTAANVVITDTIEPGLTVDPASISDGGVYDANTRTITWNITGAAAHTNGAVTFTATVNADAVIKVANEAYVQIGENSTVNSNTVSNPVEEPFMPGETNIKDPTATAIGDSFLRYKVEFTDKDGKLLTDAAQIQKIVDTMYYDTSYVSQGTVADPSTLTSNIIKGESYSTTDLTAMIDSGVVYKEYNQILFTYDTTRVSDDAVRYYNYTANNGLFTDGTVATLFTNVVMPSDWNRTDFEILGESYIIKVTAQVCQIDGLTQEQAYEALDKEAP